MRFHPKKYVEPTLSQQFLSKELESLQPKTVIEKLILVFGFYLGSVYFAVNDIYPCTLFSVECLFGQYQ